MNSLPEAPSNTPLNPALKSRTETVYDTRTVTPAPIDTASASEGEGEGWPVQLETDSISAAVRGKVVSPGADWPLVVNTQTSDTDS